MMKSIIKRIRQKIMLWLNFYRISSNFWPVVWYRIINMLHLDSVLPYQAVIRLKNGIAIDYGNRMDLSAVPVVVEIWDEQIYNPPGYLINDNDVVFDLGANVGNFAMYAAKQSHGQIYAFEPVPKNFQLLTKNISSNNLANVTPVQAAVTDKSGTVVLHVSAVDTAHSVTHKAFAQAGDLEVPAVDLESFCDQQGIVRINFLKIDCEGAEYDIIANISADMLHRIQTIAIEHHERFVHRDHAEISNRLRSSGFQVMELPDHFIYATRLANSL